MDNLAEISTPPNLYTVNKVYGYTRVSTDKQETDNQKHIILEYAHNNGIKIDEIIETTVSSRKDREKRLIDDTLEQLSNGDTLIVYSLDRIGRSTLDTLQIIEDIKNKGIKLILIKDNLTIDPYNSNPYNEMMLTMLSAFAQLERSFISERTKAGLAARKAQGIKLGRKKGQQVKSIYDEHREKIEELFTLGLSLKKIVQYINVGSAPSLHKYIKTRGIEKRLF
jgi:DNA invertase Pin-like site-specific DNA recombinase